MSFEIQNQNDTHREPQSMHVKETRHSSVARQKNERNKNEGAKVGRFAVSVLRLRLNLAGLLLSGSLSIASGLLVLDLLVVGSGLLVLLVLADQVVHVGLGLSELHLVHALTCE